MVDSDHTRYKTTRRSCIGFIFFLNMVLIRWISRKQPTVESDMFGAEFFSMNYGVETLQGRWYKFSMMGVSIEGPSYIYCENISVIYNAWRS